MGVLTYLSLQVVPLSAGHQHCGAIARTDLSSEIYQYCRHLVLLSLN